jgi:four helix bundle protein
MTNNEIITNYSSSKQNYNLEERTARFGEDIIKFAKKIPITPATKSLIDQLVRAGTSVGANYCEANDASSRRDFFHKIGICRKESKESKHWLRMIAVAVPDLKKEAGILWSEAQELNLIFSSIKRKEKAI